MIQYLASGEQRKHASGQFVEKGREPNGALILEGTGTDLTLATTHWSIPSHSARHFGAALLKSFVGDRTFPYPKSLYAVEDVLRFFVGHVPDATVLDFFAGSGTSSHAVMRLNKQDGGRRVSISVTNNEVSEAEQSRLRSEGLSPGDPEWERWGICEFITMPRITAAVTGMDPTGTPIEGTYKFADEFPMADGFSENFEFVELAYQDQDSVSRGKAFEAIAPLLWMKFGASGVRIDKVTKPFSAPNGAAYAILFDVAQWQAFVEAIQAREDLTDVCVVTDSAAQYQQIVKELPSSVRATMLYEDYLRNFEINVAVDA